MKEVSKVSWSLSSVGGILAPAPEFSALRSAPPLMALMKVFIQWDHTLRWYVLVRWQLKSSIASKEQIFFCLLLHAQ